MGRPHHNARHGVGSSAKNARDAVVSQDGAPASIHDDVGRFNITVNHPSSGGIVNSRADGGSEGNHVGGAHERCTPGQFGQHGSQGGTLNQLHNHESRRPFFTEIEDLDDVRMT